MKRELTNETLALPCKRDASCENMVIGLRCLLIPTAAVITDYRAGFN
jgi:hypothetical protein